MTCPYHKLIGKTNSPKPVDIHDAYFVAPHSIVRRIWGSADTVLIIFAGAAAEFALNKAVDWLYFTGKLPADPLGRLFSTVSYAHNIIFSSHAQALRSIDAMAAIHAGVELQRGSRIPDWAYRDVLYMLVDYSITAWELLEEKLSLADKHEVYDVFYRMGTRMGLKDLPTNYTLWLPHRLQHLQHNLCVSEHTHHLFSQYHKHLRPLRYHIMLHFQAHIVPTRVAALLKLKKKSGFNILVAAYSLLRKVGLDAAIKWMLLPAEHKQSIARLNIKW